MSLDALQAGLDDDRAFFLANPDRRHRCRRASPAEVTAARAASPETVFSFRQGPIWYAQIRLLMRRPMVSSALYIQGPRRLDLRTATEERVSSFHDMLQGWAVSAVAAPEAHRAWAARA